MARASREKLETELALQLRAAKLPEPTREYRFHPDRKWRFDFAWPDRMFAVEIQGGTYSSGRHSRGVGITRDLEKLGQAMLLGWTVYCCDTVLVSRGDALRIIEAMLASPFWK